MHYFVEQAASYLEAERVVREKYGARARIMWRRVVRIKGFMGLFSREGVQVTGVTGPETPRGEAARIDAPQKNDDFEQRKQQVLQIAHPHQKQDGEPTMTAVLDAVRELREHFTARPLQEDGEQQHASPVLARLDELLAANDFDSELRARLVRRARGELTVEQLEDEDEVQQRMVEWIGELIPIHIPKRRGRQTKIIALVGPTGVGKTTTLAKLAKLYGIDSNSRGAKRIGEVRIITVDNYRIAAREQIETYGRIMDIPVAYVESADAMRRQLALYDGADYVLVDTIGKSQRESSQLGAMNELLATCGSRLETMLVMSATTKGGDLLDIMQQFEPFGYSSVIVTKLDETNSLGTVIGALAKRTKPVAFLTDGQGVPNDIDWATVTRMLIQLDGFKIDRERLEKRFGGE